MNNAKAENIDSSFEAPRVRSAIVYFVCQTKEQISEKTCYLNEYAASNGFSVHGVFYDKEGEAPHVFLNLLDICCRMKRAVLIIESFECISFSDVSAQAIIHYASCRELRIVAADKNYYAQEGITAAAFRYLKYIANYFGFGSERGTSALHPNDTVPMRGAIGRLPLGYRVRDSRIEVEPRSAETVRSIFELFSLGVSVNEIERRIKERFSDVKCPTRNQIYFIIENSRYIGSNDSGIALPPIIDNKLWLDARAESRRRGLGAKEHCFLLNNLFFSGCGRMKPVQYCRSAHSPAYVYESRDMSVSIRADEIEKTVLRSALAAFENDFDEIIRLCKQAASEAPRIENERSSFLEKRDRLLESSCGEIGGSYSSKSIIKTLDSRRAAIKLLNISIEYDSFLLELLSRTEAEIDRFFLFMKRLDTLCAAEIKYFLNLIIKDVTVSYDEICICCYLSNTKRIHLRCGLRILHQGQTASVSII